MPSLLNITVGLDALTLLEASAKLAADDDRFKAALTKQLRHQSREQQGFRVQILFRIHNDKCGLDFCGGHGASISCGSTFGQTSC